MFYVLWSLHMLWCYVITLCYGVTVSQCNSVRPCYGVMELSKVISPIAWVTRSDHAKGAKDDVKGPKGAPARIRDPKGPFTFCLLFLLHFQSGTSLCFHFNDVSI